VIIQLKPDVEILVNGNRFWYKEPIPCYYPPSDYKLMSFNNYGCEEEAEKDKEGV
jgi:hypothetical protein